VIGGTALLVVCLNLSSLAGTKVTADGCVAPSLNDWTRDLYGSSVVGRPGDFKPLILDDRSRLYLYRYWDYERKLIDFIRKRTEDTQKTGAGDIPRLREGIAHLFPAWGPNADWQKIAAAVTLLRPFVVISGSPGTGKTSTVTKIIALLLGGSHSGRFRIALAAPTGKAAIKLQEALRRGKETLDVPDAVKGAMPDEASTIHRLLGAVQGSTFFRHNERNPLPVDVVIVDEASMIDLPLMSKLVQAVPD
jgi:exodeoxyribonuclease V alpha subunit